MRCSGNKHSHTTGRNVTEHTANVQEISYTTSRSGLRHIHQAELLKDEKGQVARTTFTFVSS
jgi:hypothetical protein